LFGDNKMPEGGGSAPSSSRLSTERTTERHTKHNSKYQVDNIFNVNTNTCVMSATLGNPPPLRKANLQAKQTVKRSTFQDKGSKESKKSEGRTKSRGEKKSKSSAKREKTTVRTNDGATQNLSPPRQPAPRVLTSNTTAPSVPVTSDLGDEINEDSLDDDGSISSELSEMSNSSDEEFDPDDPFPMTEAEKEELQLQQHKQYLQMGGLGHLAKQGALTAPAALGSPDTQDKEGIASSIEAAQLQHSQQHLEEQDQMYKLDNGFQWKKGNDVLGHGSFGQVYKGMNYDTGELLAVKQICLNDGTEDEVSLLRKEIDVMKDLDHPNIVR
jgi:hypothetical protein